MKYALVIFFSFGIAFNGKSQEVNYGDSSITLVLTQRTAYWVGQYIRTNFQWNERNAPNDLKISIGSGNNPDSVFTRTFKAKYLLWAMDAIISQPLGVSYTDYRSIVMNQPSVPGYTALVTQINTIANGNGAQKLTATWLKDQYALRTTSFDNLYLEQKNKTVQWSRE